MFLYVNKQIHILLKKTQKKSRTIRDRYGAEKREKQQNLIERKI